MGVGYDLAEVRKVCGSIQDIAVYSGIRRNRISILLHVNGKTTHTTYSVCAARVIFHDVYSYLSNTTFGKYHMLLMELNDAVGPSVGETAGPSISTAIDPSALYLVRNYRHCVLRLRN